MNKDQFEGNWKQIRGKIKEKWGKLTDNDLTQINGKFDQFVGSLQKAYGLSKEKAEEEIRNFKLEQSKAAHPNHEEGREQPKGQNQQRGEQPREKAGMR